MSYNQEGNLVSSGKGLQMKISGCFTNGYQCNVTVGPYLLVSLKTYDEPAELVLGSMLYRVGNFNSTLLEFIIDTYSHAIDGVPSIVEG